MWTAKKTQPKHNDETRSTDYCQCFFNIVHVTLNIQIQLFVMKDLIEKLIAEGLTEQQAYKAIDVIKNFTKEKFPMFSGAIDELFDKYKGKDEDDFLDA